MDKSAVPSKQMASMPRERSRLEGIPWLVLVSLLTVLICIGTSISIVLLSNAQTVDSWKIQPAVILAFLASVSNVALGAAFSAAVVVTWWTSAIDGASLSQLHYIWDRGEGLSFFSALAAGANARRVVLASSVIVIVKLSTNPLLQRATHQRIDTVMMRESIKLNSAQYIPDNWLGVSESYNDYALFPRAAILMQDWLKNTTIHSVAASPGYYCDGTCEGNVPGAGIHYNCSSTTQILNLLTAKDNTVFLINSTLSHNSTGAPFLLLTTMYSSAIDDACKDATLMIDNCKIETGIVEYPILLQNSTITLAPDKLNNVTVLGTYVHPGDVPSVLATNSTALGPLRVLESISYFLFSQHSWTGPSGPIVIPYGFLLGNSFTNYEESTDNSTCGKLLTYSSPTSYVLNSLQNFMFRTALAAANDTEPQIFTVRRTKPALVFHSIYGYVAASSVITLLGLLITLIMLQGWWVLGRTVTLSPLETAKAFCAPLMERAGYYNVTVDRILGDVGQIWVKYVDGVMTVHPSGPRDIVQPLKEEVQIHEGAEAQGGNDEGDHNTNGQDHESLTFSSSRQCLT